MRLLLSLVAAFTAFAQTGEDARSLLESISQTIRAADTLRLKGAVLTEFRAPDRPARQQKMSFATSMRKPLFMRIDVLGPIPALEVCDGTFLWKYEGNSYSKRAATVEGCDPPFGRWRNLTGNLVEAKIAGHGILEFQGRSQDCLIVEATYETPKPLNPALAIAGRMKRTFWIDSTRHLILREYLEGEPQVSAAGAVNASTEITYSEIELNLPLEPDAFRFDPPPGAQEVANPKLQISPPVLMTKQEPEYTSEALKAKLQGTVLLSLTVGVDGKPEDVKVIRGLGLGLDEKAVEAVQSWKFKPATKGGQPVPMLAQVQVNFQLRDKPH